jgi:hypothetical protein
MRHRVKEHDFRGVESDLYIQLPTGIDDCDGSIHPFPSVTPHPRLQFFGCSGELYQELEEMKPL